MEIFRWALSNNGEDYFYISASAIEGKGVFSNVNIPKDTILFTGKIALSDEGIHVFDHVWQNIKNSSQPSAYFNEEGELISVRDIHKDEEITINYYILEKAG